MKFLIIWNQNYKFKEKLVRKFHYKFEVELFQINYKLQESEAKFFEV